MLQPCYISEDRDALQAVSSSVLDDAGGGSSCRGA